MDNLIALLGMLFFMFLVLAASVEVILEVFRGTLEQVGITWAKGKVSLEDALKLAAEFSPNNGELNTKLQAVKSTAEQISRNLTERRETIKGLEEKLKGVLDAAVTQQVAGEINALASAVRADLETSERTRIFILRFLAALIGCGLVMASDFYVFQMLAESPEAKALVAKLPGLSEKWVNIAVGGLAAAAGSSYWHDKLDKVRNLKALSQELKKATG